MVQYLRHEDEVCHTIVERYAFSLTPNEAHSRGMGLGFSSRTHVSRWFNAEHLRRKRLRQRRRESASARTKINDEVDRPRHKMVE